MTVKFLEDLTPRPLNLKTPGGEPVGLYVGNGDNAIEVAVVAFKSRPAAGTLRQLWKARRDGRATPVLIAALHGDAISLCGPMGETPPILDDLDRQRAEQICLTALDEPNRNEAVRFLSDILPTLEQELPGIRNEGLFANHALRRYKVTDNGEPWAERIEAAKRAKPVLKRSGRAMLEALGYALERADNLTLLLASEDRKRGLAVLLEPEERPESLLARFNGLSPVSYALTKAEAERLPWVILVRNGRLRLYPTDINKGVGRRGRTETYVEIDTRVLGEKELAYLWFLFSAEALRENGFVAELLEQSERFAGDLAKALRERIYADVVPRLAKAVADARSLKKPTQDDLDFTYRVALTILFRLLFIAYAEDGDLLPYKSNEAYRTRSLKRKAQELLEAERKGLPLAPGATHWDEIQRIFLAVDKGNPEWGVPEYNGGLFTAEAAVSKEGAAIKALSIPNDKFIPALRSLLIAWSENGPEGPVDFRSLGVREFGTIYEGLLESELSVADTDLALKSQKGELVYVPAKKKDVVEIRAGEIYLHNRSGARKSSGSYYTKSFAVEHLLDRALEPALQDHFRRLDALDDIEAADALFDFRVADIAMGSAHFLVAAIDRIERRFAEYLSRRAEAGRPLSKVLRELEHLREAAVKQLGAEASSVEIEDTQLLRRLIARRCIYGVDLNPLAVELARLAVWIHTFVPGLPLAVLDHNLTPGNALIGVGTMEEIKARLDREKGDLFGADIKKMFAAAEAPLNRLRQIADASIKDVEASRAAMKEARRALDEMQALCDVLTAEPLDPKIEFRPENWTHKATPLEKAMTIDRAREALKGLSALHFPIAFPEVFLRERSGFDVLLGNPPWKKPKIENHAFWARHFPGLRGLKPKEMESRLLVLPKERPDLAIQLHREKDQSDRFRIALLGGSFPGMETGDADVYKAFSWRFFNLATRDGGSFGIVLPRSAFSAMGSSEFRKELFVNAASVDLTMMLNKAGWVFDEAEHRYTIGLVGVERAKTQKTKVSLRGPYAELGAYQTGIKKPGHQFSGADVLSWNDVAALPLLPTEKSFEIFLKMRAQPRLDFDDGKGWRARPDAELHATNDKGLMDLTAEKPPKGYWPVMKGESFDIWQPEGGDLYGWADPKPVMDRLQDKRLRGQRSARDSAHGEFPPSYVKDRKTLPCLAPRLAFRDVTNRTNARTVIATLLPPKVFLTHKAPYFLWPRGDQKDIAFMLGVWATIPLDWFARRMVELNMTYFVINAFPIPRPERTDKRWKRVVSIAGRLAAVDDRYKDWADAVGVECGPIDALKKNDLIAELDAVVAHLYGLSRDQLIHIFETFHEGWDYAARLAAVLEHFDAWEKKGP